MTAYEKAALVKANTALNLTNAMESNNFMKTKGVCLEDTGIIADWLLSAGVTSATRSTTEKIFETGSHLFTIPFAGYHGLTKAINYDFTSVNIIAIPIYIKDIYQTNNIDLRLSNTEADAGTANNWTNYYKLTAKRYTSTNLHSGWNNLKFHKDDFTAIGTPNWGVMRAIRIIPDIFQYIQTTAWANSAVLVTSTVVGIGGIYLDPTFETPKLLFAFDDSSESMYTNGMPYMRAKGIKGTIFVCKNHTREVAGASYMTSAEHDNLYNAGWDMCNHGEAHGDYFTMTSAQILADIKAGRDYLLSKGYTRTANIMACPNNRYTDAIVNQVQSCDVKMMRGTNQIVFSYVTNDELFKIPTYEITNVTSTATIQGWIDLAIKMGSSLAIFTHGIVAATPDAYSMLTADFQTIMDYIVTKRAAGSLEPMTFSEFYNKLTDVKIVNQGR